MDAIVSCDCLRIKEKKNTWGNYRHFLILILVLSKIGKKKKMVEIQRLNEVDVVAGSNHLLIKFQHH